MAAATSKRPAPTLPEVKSSNWQGEILDGYTVSFGQAVPDSPPRQPVEFSYIVTPAIFISPDAQFARARTVLIFAPTQMKTEFLEAGRLLSPSAFSL